MDVSELLKDVVEKESQFKTTVVKKPIDVDLDMGNLLVCDTNPIDDTSLKKSTGSYLTSLNRDNIQLLLNSVWELPTERVEDAIVAELPAPSTALPREKPIPKPKKQTKWEAYANLKGIQKRKKERMVWDETHREYRPAWGYKRANDETKQWLIEVPDNADPMEDQFEKVKTAKKERVAKNELQRMKNIARNSKGGIPASTMTPTEKPTKEQLSQALVVAKASTASVGKFTKALPKENEVKKPRGKKRKFESNTGSMSDEKERQLNVLTQLGRKQPKINTNVAVKHNRREEEQARRMEKEAGGKSMSKKMARKQASILSGKKKGAPGGKKRRGKR